MFLVCRRHFLVCLIYLFLKVSNWVAERPVESKNGIMCERLSYFEVRFNT
jgi:hypothetical protein